MKATADGSLICNHCSYNNSVQ